MGAFVRQLAVLSVLWAVCELLLPDGRQQQMVRMTVSVLVMTALLSAAGDLLSKAPAAQPTLAQQAVKVSEGHYRQTALKAAANQTAAYCERFFAQAGYEAEGAVLLRMDGTLERIEIVFESHDGLRTPEKTARLLAQQLGIEAERIRLYEAGAEIP